MSKLEEQSTLRRERNDMTRTLLSVTPLAMAPVSYSRSTLSPKSTTLESPFPVRIVKLSTLVVSAAARVKCTFVSLHPIQKYWPRRFVKTTRRVKSSEDTWSRPTRPSHSLVSATRPWRRRTALYLPRWNDQGFPRLFPCSRWEDPRLRSATRLRPEHCSRPPNAESGSRKDVERESMQEAE